MHHTPPSIDQSCPMRDARFSTSFLANFDVHGFILHCVNDAVASASCHETHIVLTRHIFSLSQVVVVLIMYATSKNAIQQPTLAAHMCIICLHLTQRFLTLRFLTGLLTGIVFTLILYHPKPAADKPAFRADQSKFEYEKNQSPSDDGDPRRSSAWNSSWDG